MWSRVPTRMELEIRESGTMRASVRAPIKAAAIAIDCTSAFLAGTFLSCPAINRERPRETFRGGLPCLGIRAREFTPECGKDTTGRRLVPVAAGDVFADEQRQRLIGRLPLDLGFEAGGERLNCLTAGFGNELVLGGEMAVETAVGEPGSPHQPGETSLRDSVAQKLGARRLEYALACFGGFCF